MKLIDILVQELPKLGGWPAGAFFAMQDSDGLVKFSKSGEKIYHDHNDGHEWCSEGGHDWIRDLVPFEGNFRTQVSHDNVTAFISREKYEAVLAASKKEWDGEGLPPVGCECEFNAYDRGWEKCVVLYVSKYTVLLRTDRASDPEEAFIPGDVEFRPIRSEADKKKYAEINELIDAINLTLTDIYASRIFMDAIRDRRIPGIRID